MQFVEPGGSSKKFTYNFDDKTGKTSGEFDLIFESKNSPDGVIQFSPYFNLEFEYTDGQGNNGFAGSCSFDLFLTWEKPGYKYFEKPKRLRKTAKLKCSENSNKKNILESLLYIGCKQASTLGKQKNTQEANEEEILDAIFKEFADCKVNRRRNQFPNNMGYWRGHSKLRSSRKFGAERGLRFLLYYGEARCGEWTTFFLHLALCQGIELKQFVILSGNNPVFDPTKYNNTIFLVKNWKVQDPKPPLPKTSVNAQGNNNPMRFFWDHVFIMFTKGSSLKFYDPSYGLISSNLFSNESVLLNEYTTIALDGVLYVKEDSTTGLKFKEDKHVKDYIDPAKGKASSDKYKYKTVAKNMEECLEILIIDHENNLQKQIVKKKETL